MSVAINEKKAEQFVTAVSMILIMLFVYAAVSKLMEMNKFINQIRLSPLIPAGFHKATALLIPLGEILISIALCFKATRRMALYASYFLMTLFTLYLFFLLKYSTFIPCSCGGILGEMSWTTHIIFNICIALLAGWACIYEERSFRRSHSGLQLQSTNQ